MKWWTLGKSTPSKSEGEMLHSYGIIREAAAVIANAALETTTALAEGRIEQEPAFTERMLGRMEHAMDGFVTKGVRWRVKSFTDRGRGAQESRIGADFVGVLQVNLPDYHVEKGFLAQAKLIGSHGTMAASEFRRMRDQCEKMLEFTPESFVFFYSTDGIQIVPALAVLSIVHENLKDLYKRSVKSFYEDHFECYIGDRRLSAPDIKAVESLRHDLQLPRLLYLCATPSRTPPDKEGWAEA